VRLFVAVDVPQAVREALAVARARLEKLCRSARWVRIEGAHVTLKFIGEVPDEQFESIRAALRNIRLHPRRLDRERPDLENDGRVATQIDLHFAGLGFFSNERRPRVFWAGIEGGPALGQLAAAIEAALVPVGSPRENRDFRPHLTLARFDSPEGVEPLRRAVAEISAVEFGRAAVREFYLYRSVLKRSGAEYTRLETYPLSWESSS
jgi:RNA 2',3'-cyclic 3'-phosphodiesterase